MKIYLQVGKSLEITVLNLSMRKIHGIMPNNNAKKILEDISPMWNLTNICSGYGDCLMDILYG